jgi:hypothetical protein
MWPIDPTRPVINVADARLQHLLLADPQRCATLGEYAYATGIEVDRLIDLFGPYLDDETLRLEPVGGEVFVLTAPSGRPQPLIQDQVPPNLWELLRGSGEPEHAYRLWRLTRELQTAGWSVEADTHRIPATSAGEVALVGLRMHRHVVPVMVFPAPADVAHPAGVLTRFERRQVPFVAVMCERGDLDAMVTAGRQWFLERPEYASLRVLVLEAPRFQPVLLGGGDGAIIPKSITRDGLQQLLEDTPDRHGGTTAGANVLDHDGIDPSTPPR